MPFPRTFALAAAAAMAGTLTSAQPVSFSKDIQPIFESSCWKCHGSAVQLSKLDLRTREAALTGGIHGPSIAPGKPESSRLFRMIAGTEKPSMPMDGKLTTEQVDKIRRWIEAGAPWETAAHDGLPTPLEVGAPRGPPRVGPQRQVDERPGLPRGDEPEILAARRRQQARLLPARGGAEHRGRRARGRRGSREVQPGQRLR